MKNKFRYFFLLLLIFFSISFPGITHAGEWWEFWRPITATFDALEHIITNLSTFILLFFTGAPLVFAIWTAITYIAMFSVEAISSAIFFIIKPLIEQTLSVTVVPGPNTVDVVNQGWAISRDIASMFFIVILAFIGLATILGRETYQVKKLLPALLIMAVLLNFSGLAVGFATDVSNLIAYGFINRISFWNPSSAAINETLSGLEALMHTIPPMIFSENPINFFLAFAELVLGATVKVIFYTIFNLTVLVILLLFIIRIGILWILTVLAPFAFASYVLPETRKFWSQWWQALFQWSFMVVPMSFFIYLAFLINTIPTNIESVNYGGWFGDILKSFIRPLLILLFLQVGFITSITFVPKAAQSITTGGQKGFAAFEKTLRQSIGKEIKGSSVFKGIENRIKEAEIGWHKGWNDPKKSAWRESAKGLWKGREFKPQEGIELEPRKGWEKRAPEITAAVAKGAASAFKDALGAGWGAGWGAAIGKKEKKKYKRCPECRVNNPDDAVECVDCGHIFTKK